MSVSPRCRAPALAALALLLSLVGRDAAASDRSIPMGKGLPVVVRTGAYFLDVEQVDDATGTFDATLDLRMTWDDPRLRFSAREAPAGFLDLRDADVEARLSEIWSPQLVLRNLVGDPAFVTERLRVYPSGRVEWMRRTKGQFRTDFDVTRFPFDRQRLSVDILSRQEPTSRLILAYQQAELDFSRHVKELAVVGWQIGAVDLVPSTEVGWDGDRHSTLSATLTVAREPLRSIPPIFVPLLASLIIPLIALWLNQCDEEGEFKVEAFELTNVLIGGLFALIALNFTINSSYPMLAEGNPVATLFGLNYLLLAVSFAINIGVMRFGVVKRLFGPHVQAAVFAYCVWALPAAVLVCGAAIVLHAMA